MTSSSIFHQMRRLIHDHTKCWNESGPTLTKAQYAVLRAVADNPGIEQRLLVAVSATSKATLAELLRRLEAKGLLNRGRNETDARRTHVTLTQTGRRALQDAVPRAEDVDHEFLDVLNPEEQQRLGALLHKMLRES